MVQWLGFHAFTAKGGGSIPGWGTKIPEAALCSQKKEGGQHEQQKYWVKLSVIWGNIHNRWYPLKTNQSRHGRNCWKFERQMFMLTLSMKDFCRIRGLSLILLFQPRFLSHMYFIFPFCLRPITGCLPRDPRVWAYLYSIINFVWFLIVIHFGIKQDSLPSWRVPSSTNSYLYLILTFYFEQDSMVSPSETTILQGHLEIKKMSASQFLNISFILVRSAFICNLSEQVCWVDWTNFPHRSL